MGDANAPRLSEHEREQQQRHVITVIGNDNKRLEASARADRPVPRPQEIKPLIGGREVVLKFQVSPDCPSLVKIGEYIDCADAA